MCEQAHDRDQEIVEECLVRPSEGRSVLEGHDRPLGVLTAVAAAEPAGEGREVELVPVDVAHGPGIGTNFTEMRDRLRVQKLTADARAKLGGPNFGYLAVDDGSPHVSPVWVDTDGRYILVNTARGRVKERAMQEGARVALSIAEHDDPYDHVDIRGAASSTASRATKPWSTSTRSRASTAGPTACLPSGRASNV
jgi:hypothetical protein